MGKEMTYPIDKEIYTIAVVIGQHTGVAVYNIYQEDKTLGARKREFVDARQILMYLTRDIYPRKSYKHIGKQVGNRDHSSVMHAISAINDRMDVDKDFKKMYEIIKELALKDNQEDWDKIKNQPVSDELRYTWDIASELMT